MASLAVGVTTNSIVGLALGPGCHAPSVISPKITFVRFVGYSYETVLSLVDH